MSLLQRLGKTKEHAIKEVEQQKPEDWRQPANKSDAPRSPQSRDGDMQGVYSRVEAPRQHHHTQMASAFAGRRAAVVELDQIQELRLAIHRRIVDEMTVTEQLLLAQGESAKEQIKALISSYLEREMASNTYSLSRS
jgi:pilus assembly protein CpaF